jgi:hypothetical protein
MPLAIPKPWMQGDGSDRVGLTANGEMALGRILLLHDDCLNLEKVDAYFKAHDGRAMFRELATAAKRFIERHRNHSCIPGLKPEHLCTMMFLYSQQCEYRAGVLDENGELVN